MNDPLLHQLLRCCVKIKGSSPGTGFFVAPGLVLTCAHVVGQDLKPGEHTIVTWDEQDDKSATIQHILSSDEEDLALIQVQFGSHPCVKLGTDVRRGDKMYVWGFPDWGRGPLQDGIDGDYESLTRVRETESADSFHKFKSAHVGPGFSGGPLLNLRTGSVIGVVTETRDASGPTGGWAIRTNLVIEKWKDVADKNAAYHRDHSEWKEARRQQSEVENAAAEMARRSIVGDHRSLPVANKIKNFIADYVGTALLPEPFGGREPALARLNAWLQDSAQSPYLLLTAPAGRGKSALLVRWAIALSNTAPDLHVIFVPVSVRYEINSAQVVLGALVGRLAALLGEDHGYVRSASPEELQDRLAEYVSREAPAGKRALIILDGVDEAAGWDVNPGLFPQQPGRGIRLVLSARPTAVRPDARRWLEQLRWENSATASSFTLEALDIEGVRDVIERMGAPLDQLSRQPQIVTELHRLTQGDPLLVSLYVKDLWTDPEQAKRLKAEDLGRLQPGIEGYFARWWEDQESLWGKSLGEKRAEVAVVLNILATAFAPLERADLLRLAKSRTTIDGSRLDAALQAMKRFVVKGADRETYVLAHPRFATYRFGLLRKDGEDSIYEKPFLDWGEEVVQRLRSRTDGTAISPYIVQFYRAHLERSKAGPLELLRLADRTWQSAWETVCEEYHGFASDLNRAWKAAAESDRELLAKGEPATLIDQQLRCALLRAETAGQSDLITEGLLAALARHGVWSARRTLNYVRQIENNFRRSAALAAVAPYLSAETMSAAINTVQQLAGADQEDYGAALSGVCRRLFDLGQRDVALTLLRGESIGYARAYVTVEVFSRLNLEEQRELLAIVREQIAQEGGHYQIVLVRKLIDGTPLPDARRILTDPWTLVDPFVRDAGIDNADVLALVAAWLEESDKTARLCEILQKQDPKDGRGSFHLAVDIVELAPHLRGDSFELALHILRQMEPSGNCAAALLALWPNMSAQQRVEFEGLVLDQIKNALDIPGVFRLQTFCRHLIAAGYGEETLVAISTRDVNPYRLEDIVVGIAPELDEKQVRYCLDLGGSGDVFERAKAALLARLASFGYKEAKEALSLTRLANLGESLLLARSFLQLEISSEQTAANIFAALCALRDPALRLEALAQAAEHLPALDGQLFSRTIDSFGKAAEAVEAIGLFSPKLTCEGVTHADTARVVEYVVENVPRKNEVCFVREFFRRLAVCDKIEYARKLANDWCSLRLEVPLLAYVSGVANHANAGERAELIALATGFSDIPKKAAGFAAILGGSGDDKDLWDEFVQCLHSFDAEARSVETAQIISSLPAERRGTALSLLISERYLNGQESIYYEGFSRARALHDLAPVLTKEMIDVVLARKPDFKTGEGNALWESAVASRLAVLGFPEEALQMARWLGDSAKTGKAIAAIIKHSPVEKLANALALVFDHDNTSLRKFVWRALSLRWDEIPKLDLLQHLENWLRRRTKTAPRELLDDLRGFSHAIYLLGGEQAIRQCVTAIDEHFVGESQFN